MSSLFDYCARGKHSDCTKEFERWTITRRKGKSIFSYTGEFVKCSCTCHRKKDV